MIKSINIAVIQTVHIKNNLYIAIWNLLENIQNIIILDEKMSCLEVLRHIDERVIF